MCEQVPEFLQLVDALDLWYCSLLGVGWSKLQWAKPFLLLVALVSHPCCPSASIDGASNGATSLSY